MCLLHFNMSLLVIQRILSYVWRICVCILNICWRYAVAEKPVFNGPCEYTPHTKGNSLQGSFYQTVRPSTVCSVPKIPSLILRVNIQNTVQYCTMMCIYIVHVYLRCLLTYLSNLCNWLHLHPTASQNRQIFYLTHREKKDKKREKGGRKNIYPYLILIPRATTVF